MPQIWNQELLQELILRGDEESSQLDYKEARAIGKSDGKKTEITKDVSAMANAAGGIIIYGIAEFQDHARKHLPEKIDPLDRVEYPKEWLEQVINNIQPKIDGLVIYPIPINTSPNHVVYVVEIPQSYTAHQAKDFRYYQRGQFESVPMLDYQIRDVMGRCQHPQIELKFNLMIETKVIQPSDASSLWSLAPDYQSKKEEPKQITEYTLIVNMLNTGRVYAQHVQAQIKLPCELI